MGSEADRPSVPLPPPPSPPLGSSVCAPGVAERTPFQSLRDGRVGGPDATPASTRDALLPPPVLPHRPLSPRSSPYDKGNGGWGEH
eukprot:6213903-Pleurochrysis_carterae.AAC.1